MCLSNSELDDHIAKRQLIAISRKELGSNKRQGFPLAYSPDLLVLRYVHDFYLDGLLLVRRNDITESFCRGTDKFQRKLLEAENLLKRRLFSFSQPLGSLHAFLSSLGRKQVVIIENESPDIEDFYIGRIVSANQESIELQVFSGVGNWEKNTTKIPTKDVTCCQLESNYISFYARHFQRTAQ